MNASTIIRDLGKISHETKGGEVVPYEDGARLAQA